MLHDCHPTLVAFFIFSLELLCCKWSHCSKTWSAMAKYGQWHISWLRYITATLTCWLQTCQRLVSIDSSLYSGLVVTFVTLITLILFWLTDRVTRASQLKVQCWRWMPEISLDYYYLVHVCQVWSTSVSAFVSYPVYGMTERMTDRTIT